MSAVQEENQRLRGALREIVINSRTQTQADYGGVAASIARAALASGGTGGFEACGIPERAFVQEPWDASPWQREDRLDMAEGEGRR